MTVNQNDRRREVAIREVSAQALAGLPEELGPVLRRIYAARGVDADSLDTSLAGLLPVSSLDGAEDAAARLAAARVKQEQIVIVGDFDADGATATALMMRCCSDFGFEHVDYLVPDRDIQEQPPAQ